ncbi:MAG: signal recognition particle protein Srp19, partial [Candidatus Aenigmarchaeota archaeon]|nr:signal recognition particle protein Srp19 [Candidatus Aenigmarchaeota archaeon]
GMGMMKIPDELLKKQEEKMKIYKIIIQSMTKKERENPEIVSSTRIPRIAKGSGKSENDVRELINQYNQTKKMVKSFGGMKGLQRGEFKKMAQQFGLKM